MEKAYLTPAELTARWGGQPSLAVLANWRHKGTGPAYLKLEGRVLYTLAAVEAWERDSQAPDDVLTPEQLAARLGGSIKLATLANWRSRGKGPAFVRYRGRVLYPTTEINAWEQASTVTGA